MALPPAAGGGPPAPAPVVTRLRRLPPVKPGLFVYARCAEEPVALHERLVLCRVGLSGAYVCASPDHDTHVENFESDDGGYRGE